ncbi:MAG TPA: hypothetical protein PLL28_11980 [Chitinophagales bacterium]|nr:hypothetical protein [Chitinophagales bacterium]HMX03092.1 hypothetical protein [Chitinophagales bacterium]HMZ89845.1 hypothetical protein [Chitinophagales bacterium]HNA58118.1 hypothetical protein [Chitinophagales bacterium]HNE46307.1 hypothetical protein [Chitinophagales bacterium]
MMQFLRRSSALSLIATILLLGALSGKDLVHFTFAHDVSHQYGSDSRECCKQDHRQPHIHELNYCFLCHLEVSVTLHEERVVLIPGSFSYDLIPVAHLNSVHQPGFQGYSDLRGPPFTV